MINVYESAKEIDKRRQTCFNLPITGKKRILATSYESIKKVNNRVHDRETTSFSVLILIVLPEKKKKESFSAILERVPRIIYNTLHKEISTFYYDYVNKKCVQH